jgi:uncharacterized protein (TIGR03437 family)
MLKYCAVFSLWAGVGLAADYTTYQAARLVVGQTTFTSQNSGTSSSVMGAMSGIAFAANTLFVADSNRLGYTPVNNRVLLFGNVTQSMPQPFASIPPNSGRCPACVGKATVELGQPDFTSSNYVTSQSGLRTPTGVASDGQILVVADTGNNRVLIWNTIPTSNGQPADIVLGQPDFTTIQPVVATASSVRSPEGVWVQNGKLFVADTQNNRVMIWNSIPTKNNQPADVVLGQPNFTTVTPINQTATVLVASSSTMLSPVSVTSDGTHLFVTDLGFNRVLIWNSVPTSNQKPADVEVGQPDMVTAIANDAFTGVAANATTVTTGQESPAMCTVPNGTDSNGNATYPNLCEYTLNFPRFALSDGTRLYIADGGNDRVLIYEHIPTGNAAPADLVLGQPDFISDVETSTSNNSGNPNGPNLFQSASNLTPTPVSLTWDGANLYVSDPVDYRVLVFTPAEPDVPGTGIRNAASVEIHATDEITLGGTITTGNTVTITICPPVNGAVISQTCVSTLTGAVNYTYTILSTDTFNTILQGLVALINAGAGDPNVYATPELNAMKILLVARADGAAGDTVSLAESVSTSATITASATNTTLTGGNDPTTIAPGSLITILGTNLADAAVSAPMNGQNLPFSLGGVQVYCDGIALAVAFVSPTQINAEMPYEVLDATSSSCYARIQHANGSVSITDAVGVPIDLEDPGIFGVGTGDPRPAIAFHYSNYSLGQVDVNGSIQAGDIATVGVQNRIYSYTVQSTDTLLSIRNAMIALINSNAEEVVTASAGPAFSTSEEEGIIVLQAKVPGPEGNGIVISASSTNPTGSPVVTMTVTNPQLCCANVAGAPITSDNPALAGETIYLYATGLGLVGPNQAKNAIFDGGVYNGPAYNDPNATVSSLVGGVTANVISAGLMVGGIGIYQIVLQLSSGAPTNSITQVTIAQEIYTSNIVTIPVYNPNPASAAAQ